jgi:hypothetical protein
MGRLCRVAAKQPVVFPRRRQPGQVQRHPPGSAANGTSPGNGFVDLAFPQDFKTDNWGVEGGYQSSKATFSVRWDYAKFENCERDAAWTNPFFGPTVNGAQ